MQKADPIVAIAPYDFYPALIGGQKGIALFYKYFSELVNVTIIGTKPELHHNERWHYKGLLGQSKKRYADPSVYFRIKQFIKRSDAKVLIIEHPYYGWLAWLLHKSVGIPYVVHSHNIESLRFRSTGKWWWRILWQYEKFTFRHASASFFITDHDREYAVKNFKLQKENCHTITFGTELQQPVAETERSIAAALIRQKHSIPEGTRIILFNGAFDYKPNLQALQTIIQEIEPLLSVRKFNYRILICGKGIPPEMMKSRSETIIFAGFVEDISVYFKGCDIFLNPVIEGGGIKTKLVEALAYSLTVVSSKSGAEGVDPNITAGKLAVIDDHDWNGFADAIVRASTGGKISAEFFDHFYWGNIAKKAAGVIESLLRKA